MHSMLTADTAYASSYDDHDDDGDNDDDALCS